MKEISMKEEIKELVTCPYCNGTGGHEDRKMRDPLAKGIDPQAWVDCPECDGSGKIIN